MKTSTLELDDLLRHTAFLHRLARSLVRDADRAEDVVQQTWLSAIERPPSRSGDPRSWLAVVARNAAGKLSRKDGNRARIERRVASTEWERPVDELTEREELRHHVARMVLELDEPYRTAMVMRFYDDAPPRRIASALGVPVETVRTRIKRGLERIRAGLDDRHGGHRDWRALLIAPGARPAGAMATSITAGALLAGTILLIWLVGRPARLEGPAASSQEAAPVVAGHHDSPSPRDAEPLRSPTRALSASVNDASPPPAVTTAGLDEASIARGRVVDVNGSPVAGVAVGWLLDRYRADWGMGERVPLDEPRATSDELGYFELEEVEPSDAVVAVLDDRWSAIGSAVDVNEVGQHVSVVIVAPTTEIRGVVLTEQGSPIANAWVRLYPDTARFGEAGVAGGVPWTPAEATSPGWIDVGDRSADDGTFQITGVPMVDGWTRVTVMHRQFEAVDEPLSFHDPWVTLRLHRNAQPASRPLRLHGAVTFASGEPAPDAVVRFGWWRGTTDEEGRYSLDVDRTRVTRAWWLTAIHDDGVGGMVDAGAEVLGGDREEHAIDIVLHDRSAAISGRVIEPGGRPVPGLDVSLIDREGLVSFHFLEPRQTTASGAFEFPRLAAGSAVVRLSDQNTLAEQESRRIDVGETALTILFDPALVGRLGVTVRDREGRPVRGVSVQVVRTGSDHGIRAAGSTGEDGRVWIEDVPVDAAIDVSDSAGRLLPARRRVVEAEGDHLVIVLSPPCRVRIEPTPVRREAHRMRVLDRSGRPLLFVTHASGQTLEVDQLLGLRSRVDVVIDVHERARSLLFEDAEERELCRVPLRPSRTADTTVRP